MEWGLRSSPGAGFPFPLTLIDGKLGLILMGGVMLSKCLIQFLLMGRAVSLPVVCPEKIKLQNACYSAPKDAWKTRKSMQMTYRFMKL